MVQNNGPYLLQVRTRAMMGARCFMTDMENW